MWGLNSSLSEMWKDTSFAVKLAVTHIVKYLKLPSWEMWKQEGWHGHTSAVVTSCGLLLTAAQWGTHRTSKGHITVRLLQPQGGQECKPWETACVCVDGAGKGKKDRRQDWWEGSIHEGMVCCLSVKASSGPQAILRSLSVLSLSLCLSPTSCSVIYA